MHNPWVFMCVYVKQKCRHTFTVNLWCAHDMILVSFKFLWGFNFYVSIFKDLLKAPAPVNLWLAISKYEKDFKNHSKREKKKLKTDFKVS